MLCPIARQTRKAEEIRPLRHDTRPGSKPPLRQRRGAHVVSERRELGLLPHGNPRVGPRGPLRGVRLPSQPATRRDP